MRGSSGAPPNPPPGSGAQQSKRCGALQRWALPARSPRSPSRPVPLFWGCHAGLGPSITRHVFLGPSSSPQRRQGSGSEKPLGPPLPRLCWIKGGRWQLKTHNQGAVPKTPPSSSSSSCPQPTSSVAPKLSPLPSTSPVANGGGGGCHLQNRATALVTPGYRHAGGSGGTVPITPRGGGGQRGRCARSPGSVGCLPAPAGCWPPTSQQGQGGQGRGTGDPAYGPRGGWWGSCKAEEPRGSLPRRWGWRGARGPPKARSSHR